MKRRGFLAFSVLAVPGFRQRAAPVEIQATSRWLVLIDPLALDLARAPLMALATQPETTQRERLAALSAPLRIGVHEIQGFTPGRYRVDRDDIEPTPGKGADIVDVDSGAIVVTGLDCLAKLASVLTWERYDASLRANGAAMARQLQAEMGEARFAILSSDANTRFAGDGAYRLRRALRVRVER
jgi:hypothetical protein